MALRMLAFTYLLGFVTVVFRGMPPCGAVAIAPALLAHLPVSRLPGGSLW